MGPDPAVGAAAEIENFKDILKFLPPSAGDIPHLSGFDIAGLSRPLSGSFGGDHMIFVDFKSRFDLDRRIAHALGEGRTDVARRLEACRSRAGILLADVAGHRLTDALVAAMLHQAFLIGASYELELFGEVTTHLLAQVNARFQESTSIRKLIALIYGEMSSAGRFRYISAGHVPPIVYSHEYRRLMPLGADRTVSEALIGFRSARPEAGLRKPDGGAATLGVASVVNEIDVVMRGDIVLLATDGLTEHAGGRFVAERLAKCLDDARDLPAPEICRAVERALLDCAPPDDDVSLIVVKRI